MTTGELQSRLVAARSGSRLFQMAGRLLASMNAPPEEMAREVIDADEAVLRGLAGGSVLATRAAGVIHRAVEACRGAAAVERASDVRARVGTLTAWQQLRAIGIAGLVATAVNAVAALLDPSPASGYRWFLWAVAVVASIVVVLAARPLAAARRDARAIRHLP